MIYARLCCQDVRAEGSVIGTASHQRLIKLVEMDEPMCVRGGGGGEGVVEVWLHWAGEERMLEGKCRRCFFPSVLLMFSCKGIRTCGHLDAYA